MSDEKQEISLERVQRKLRMGVDNRIYANSVAVCFRYEDPVTQDVYMLDFSDAKLVKCDKYNPSCEILLSLDHVQSAVQAFVFHTGNRDAYQVSESERAATREHISDLRYVMKWLMGKKDCASHE